MRITCKHGIASRLIMCLAHPRRCGRTSLTWRTFHNCPLHLWLPLRSCLPSSLGPLCQYLFPPCALGATLGRWLGQLQRLIEHRSLRGIAQREPARVVRQGQWQQSQCKLHAVLLCIHRPIICELVASMLGIPLANHPDLLCHSLIKREQHGRTGNSAHVRGESHCKQMDRGMYLGAHNCAWALYNNLYNDILRTILYFLSYI